MDVQRGTVTLASTELTETVTLPNPVPVGESFATISMRGGSGDFRVHSCTAELSTDVGGEWTELVITRENSSAETVQHWQVVTDPKFTVAIEPVDFSGSTSTTKAITSIDQTTTFAVLTYRQGDGNAGHAGTQPTLEFTSDTEIRLQRQFGRADSHALVYIVTYEGSTVQGGRADIADTSSTSNTTISSVTLAETFVIWSSRHGGAGTSGEIFLPQVTLSDSTTLHLERTGTTSFLRVEYFIVSHPDLSVQHIVSSSDATVDVVETITSVNEGSSFMSASRQGSAIATGATSIASAVHTQELTSDTSITATRGSDTGSFTPSFFVVEGPASATDNTQQLTIDSIVHVGAWEDELGSTVAADIASSIGGETANDSTYAISELSPSSSPVVAKLSTANTPNDNTDPHTYKFRYRKDVAGGEDIQFTVEIREGWVSEPSTLGTLIHSDTVTATSDTIAELDGTLTQLEVDNITDYSDLYVRIVADAVA